MHLAHLGPGKRRALAAAAVLLAGSSLHTLGHTQAVPGAGDVIRQVPPPPALPQRQEAPTAVPGTAPGAETTPADGSPRFLLREVVLPETRGVPKAELMAVVAPFLGTQVNQRDLNTLANRVRERYQQAGLPLVGVGFPSQDVSQGIVRLLIVEPTVGRIQVVAGEDAPITEARARGLIHYFGLGSAELLNVHQLDRAMFTLNDLPGVAARATLNPSGDEGIYDLSIELTHRKRWDLALSADNHGNAVNGRYRPGALLRLQNPTGIGDNIDLRLLASTNGNLVLGRAAYELPVGYTPWRFAAGYSLVSYALGAPFDALDADGLARVFDASLSYPVLRSRLRNMVLRLGVEEKSLTDRINAFDLRTDKAITSLTAGLTYEGRDDWLGQGYTGAALQAVIGDLRIKSEDVRLADASLGRRATQGGFGKINLQASRLQGFTREMSLFVGVTAQWASKNLDSAEKLTLGGPRGVRAYPSSEAASDQGVLVTSELRYWIDNRWTVFGLVDWARGSSLKRPASAEGNTRILRGSGLGVYFTDRDLFTLKATIAWRGKDQPRSESGNDNPRLFVELQRSF